MHSPSSFFLKAALTVALCILHVNALVLRSPFSHANVLLPRQGTVCDSQCAVFEQAVNTCTNLNCLCTNAVASSLQNCVICAVNASPTSDTVDSAEKLVNTYLESCTGANVAVPDPGPSTSTAIIPDPTPKNTPDPTPKNTPAATPKNTPAATPQNTPAATPQNTPDSTPKNTPNPTPDSTTPQTTTQVATPTDTTVATTPPPAPTPDAQGPGPATTVRPGDLTSTITGIGLSGTSSLRWSPSVSFLSIIMTFVIFVVV